MYTTIKISPDLKRIVMLRSHHNRKTARSKAPQTTVRTESEYGTKAYRDALQRAFNKAKEQIFFNPDMTNFITLTYAGKDHTPEQVLHDVKMFIKKDTRQSRAGAGSPERSKPKYIYIMEYQKRGSIHVHMIANNSFSTYQNQNGYASLTHWTHGFSSVLAITDFDGNFRPYLYLFKYMKKSQRIGKSFVHTSRNLTCHTELKESSISLENWRTLTMERTEATISTTKFVYYRNFLQFDDTMSSQNNNQGTEQWLEQVRSHSMKELAKLVENHSRL